MFVGQEAQGPFLGSWLPHGLPSVLFDFVHEVRFTQCIARLALEVRLTQCIV